MGWFDNEEGAVTGTASTAGGPQRPNVKAAAPSHSGPEAGSTLGRQLRVEGTIVCGEDLTILGKVEGTIRAKGTLVIAERADVQAAIDGQRVVVHGKVEGNVHGGEKVVLGPTARLTGNIEVSTLEILEGAYFKGNVEMKAAKGAKDAASAGKGEKPAGQPVVTSSPAAQGKAVPGKTEEVAEAGAREPGTDEDSKGKSAKQGTGPGSS